MCLLCLTYYLLTTCYLAYRAILCHQIEMKQQGIEAKAQTSTTHLSGLCHLPTYLPLGFVQH